MDKILLLTTILISVFGVVLQLGNIEGKNADVDNEYQQHITSYTKKIDFQNERKYTHNIPNINICPNNMIPKLKNIHNMMNHQ